MPLLQNVKFYDKRILTLDNARARPRSRRRRRSRCWSTSSCSGASPTCKQYYVSRAGRRGGRARARLSQTVRANLAEEFNKRTMHEAISTERDKIMTETRQKADADAKTIGVEIVDVRLRRVELPPDVTGPVYARMESERRRVANELRSLGGAESEKIRADADRQREVILADAYRQAQKIKGEGDAKASAIYASAYGQNPEFYRVLPQPRGVQGDVPRARATCMVLDPSAEFFQYFKQPGGGRDAPRPPAK